MSTQSDKADALDAVRLAVEATTLTTPEHTLTVVRRILDGAPEPDPGGTSSVSRLLAAVRNENGA